MRVGFFDVQTTARHPQQGKIIQVAWRCSKVQWSSYVNVESEFLHKSNLKLLGIESSTVEQAPDWLQVKQRIVESFAEVDTVAIYFSRFEKTFLQYQQFDDLDKVICLHQLAKKSIEECDRFSIKALSGFLGFPVEDFCSKSHVLASEKIWQCILQRTGPFESHKEILDWIQRTKPIRSKRPKIEIEQRKNLPKSPGVYRFLNKNGSVLYVGKATCLKTRVSSYFSGYKGLESYKKELMHIAQTIEHTECRTPAHAAMLEVRMIQEIDPPYNRALKPKQLVPKYLNRSLQWDDVGVGPFFDQGFLLELHLLFAWQLGEIDAEKCFFTELDPKLEQFSRKWLNFVIEQPRQMLAWAIALYRMDYSEQRPDEWSSEPETRVQMVAKLKRYLVRIGRRYCEAKKLIGISQVEMCWAGEKIELGGGPLDSKNRYDQFRVLIAEARAIERREGGGVTVRASLREKYQILL